MPCWRGKTDARDTFFLFVICILSSVSIVREKWHWLLNIVLSPPLQSDAPAGAANQYLLAIEKAKAAKPIPSEYTFTERDSMLYNLGVGAKRTDLNYVL